MLATTRRLKPLFSFVARGGEIFGGTIIIARVGLRVWRLARRGFFWSDDDAGETSTLVGKCDEEEEDFWRSRAPCKMDSH